LEESSHRIQSSVPPDYHYVVEPPAELTIKEASVRIKLTELPVVDLSEVKDDDRNVEFFDMDLLEGPMIVRNSRAGDRFSPLGVNGSQKLKKFFIDHKIAPAKRKRCPLLLDGNRILWVAGYRRACECLIQPQTRRVLKAELLLA
jgi:tRNA(Ile)-lysidine synthase